MLLRLISFPFLFFFQMASVENRELQALLRSNLKFILLFPLLLRSSGNPHPVWPSLPFSLLGFPLSLCPLPPLSLSACQGLAARAVRAATIPVHQYDNESVGRQVACQTAQLKCSLKRKVNEATARCQCDFNTQCDVTGNKLLVSRGVCRSVCVCFLVCVLA